MAKRYYEGRKMMPNNGGRGAVIREDMSRPCGLPMGAIQRDVDDSGFRYDNRGVSDLFELVNKTIRQDAEGVRSLTDPKNY